MLPAARVSDLQTCPLLTGPIPHTGGPILPPGEPTVLIASMPSARLSDGALCVGPPNTIAKGEPTVLIGGKPAARMSDTMAHGGAIVGGCPTVLIGSCAAGAALASAAVTGSAYCDKT